MNFKKALGPFDATMIVIGGIIGSGIFINPYLVARQLDTTFLVLLAWSAGGAIALAGAFASRWRTVRLPQRSLASTGGIPLWLGAALHDRDGRNGGRRDRVRAIRLANVWR